MGLELKTNGACLSSYITANQLKKHFTHFNIKFERGYLVVGRRLENTCGGGRYLSRGCFICTTLVLKQMYLKKNNLIIIMSITIST